MEKFRSLVIAFVAMLVLGGSAFAASVSISTSTYTGLANFGSSGNVAFSFTLRNVSNDASVSDNTIRWTSDEAFNTTDTNRWVRADQYAVVAATVTKAGFNVYMYQTNKNSTNYKAHKPRVNYEADGKTFVSSSTSGLVRQGVTAEDNGNYRCYIPVAYSFVSTKTPSITFDGTPASDSETIKNRSDRFLVDAGDSTYPADSGSKKGYELYAASYAKIASIAGPVFGYDNGGWDYTGKNVANHTAYMYFFGNFKNIVGGDVYGTDQLHIVQVTE